MTFDSSIHTRLLLKFDGTPGSTTLVDSGLDSCVVQANGNFILSDTQVKFGPTSGFSEGDYSAPSWAVATLANAVGSSDFTIECFVFTGPGDPDNLGIGYGEGTVFALGDGIFTLDVSYSLNGDRNAVGVWFYLGGYISVFGDWYGGDPITDPTFIISNDWNHFALTRSGNDLYFHTNGKLRGVYDATSLNIPNNKVIVSDWISGGGGYLFPGYVDELRVSSYPVYTELTYDVPVVEFSTASLPVEIGVASSIDYELKAYAPALLSSCILAPPPPAPTLQPEEVIFTPVPPGIEYESLPVLDPVTQIIDTSPSQIIGCANAVPDGAEQSTLNALFPGAVDGDGVVNRQNNDIWKYDGTTWENVGPTPGPQVVVVSVLPPWNEIAIYDATVRTRLQIRSLDYALALLTEPDPIGVVLGLDARRVRRVLSPAAVLAVTAPPSLVSTSAKTAPPAASIEIASPTPSIATGAAVTPPSVATAIFAPMPKSVGLARAQINPEPTSVLALTAQTPSVVNAAVLSAPVVSFSVTATPPTRIGPLVLPNVGDAFEGGFYAGLISHTANGIPTHALIVAPRATGATGTGPSGTGYPINIDLAWQNPGSITGATSPFDGAANTALMINSPAADFCTGLSIGGYNDWYLPALFELDIAYENLKPTTFDNSTSAGTNPYSVPERTVNRTSGDPAQTSVAAFQDGGAEPFVAGDHWSSTESGSFAGLLNFATGQPSPTVTKTFLFRVRAFRKIAL
jgi:hypothetical protein